MSWRDRACVARSEAAAILGLCLRTIDKLLKEGRLSALKEGRRVLVSTASIRVYLGEDAIEPLSVDEPETPEARRVLAAALRRART